MSTSPTIYLIRHGEKPPNDGKGLSAAGIARANALPAVFGPNTTYNIKFILAETPDLSKGTETRPELTVAPLAKSLGITTNTDFAVDWYSQVAAQLKELVAMGTGDVLVCWEHTALHHIVKALDIDPAPKYDGDDFDELWKISAPYDSCDVGKYSISQ